MLDFERALARAQAQLGTVPPAGADAINIACDVSLYDVHAIMKASLETASPAVPLVAELRARVGAEAAPYVHLGATSQDAIDTATMLVASRVLGTVSDDVGRAADACARLVDEHRSTPIAARTLLQQAAPTTFGLKAAGWLDALDDCTDLIAGARRRCAVQLGGAAGTLSAFGGYGFELAGAVAAELGLATAALPWHTNRVRVARLAAALGTTAGALGKIARDVVLLAQSEVGEVSEGGEPGHGASSSMPHKRNPSLAVGIVANARRAPGLVATLLACMDHEHERAAGAWQAEWEPTRDLLRVVAVAAESAAAMLANLEIHPERMRANLQAARERFDPGEPPRVAGLLIDRALARHRAVGSG
jgi:3-carboxy-cis,cis-muconate cycloisomerase